MAEGPVPGRRRYLRRAGRVALGLLGVAVALVVVAGIGARLYLNDARSRTLAVSILDRVLAGRFHLQGFTWDRFPSSVTLRGVAIDAPDGTRVIAADRVHARIDLVALLGQQVHLTRVEAQGVEVHSDVRPGGLGLAAAFGPHRGGARKRKAPPRPGARPWTVVLDDVEAKGVAFTFHGPSVAVDVAGGAVHRGRLVLAMPKVVNDLGRVTADRVAIAWDGRRIAAEDVDVEDGRYRRTGRPKAARFAVASASATVDRSTVTVRGRATGLSRGIPWKLDVTARADLDLASPTLASLLPPALVRRLSPSGTVTVSGHVGGTTSDPRVRATVSGRGLEVAGRAIEALDAAGTLDDAGIRVDHLDLDAGGGHLAADGGLGLTGPRLPWHLDATLTRLPLRSLASVVVDPRWLPATVTGHLAASGAGLADPRGRIDARLRSTGRPAALPAAVPEALALDLRGTFTRQAAHLSALHLEGDGAAVDAAGSVPLGATGELDVTVSLDDPRPRALAGLLGAPLEVRRTRLIATATGTWGDPTVQGSLEVDGVRVPGVPALTVTAPVRLQGGALHLDHALLAGAGGQIDVTGRLGLLAPARRPGASLPVAARVRIDGIALGGLTGGRATGKVWGDLTVAGTASAPTGGGALRVEGPAVGGEKLDTATARVVLAGRTVAVKDLDLASALAGRVTGAATLDLGTRRLVAHLAGTGLDLHRVLAAAGVGVPMTGLGRLEVWATGPVTRPLIQAAAVARELTVRGTPLGRLTAWVRGTVASLQIDATVAGPPGSLDVDGIYDVRGGTVDLHLAGKRLALGAIPGLAPRAARELAEVDGRADVDVSLEGPLPIPSAKGQIRVEGLALQGTPIPGGVATFTLTPVAGGAGIHVVASALGQVTAEADLTPGPPIAVDATGTLDGLEVGRLLPALGAFHTRVVTSGTVAFAWHGGKHAGTRASVRLTRLEAHLADGTLTATRPVVATWNGETLDLADLDLAGPKGRFEAQGRVGAVLEARAKGRLETALAAPFVPAIARASGPLDVDLKASGTLGHPVFQGTIGLPAPVHLRPRAGVGEVTLTAGRIVLAPGDVRLEGLTGELETGQFTADGQVALDGLTPGAYRLALSGQNLPFRAGDAVVEANANLTVAGRGTQASVKGTVDVVRGRYLRKFELKNFIFVARPTTVSEPLARQYPWLNDIDLGVQVTSTGGMEVRVDAGALAMDLTLDSDLKITGTAADPAIEGRVSAESGTLTFPKAKLDVVRAVVEFNPIAGAGVHPEVDLRAEGEVNPSPTLSSIAQVTHYVTVGLRGNLDQMALELSSDPALDKLEVLSLLITGRVNPIAPGTVGNRSEADAALAFAGSQLAQPLTQFVTSQLDKTLNLNLQLGAEVTTQAITVTAGQAITRRLRLEGAYQQGLGDTQTVAVARARFLLSDRIFLEGSTETVSGTSSTTSALPEGSRSRLELKLRIFGN